VPSSFDAAQDALSLSKGAASRLLGFDCSDYLLGAEDASFPFSFFVRRFSLFSAQIVMADAFSAPRRSARRFMM